MTDVGLLEALFGGVIAVLTPGFLLLLPVYLAFASSSLGDDLTNHPGHAFRDYAVTLLFFLVGLVVMFMVVGSGGADMAAHQTAARIFSGLVMGLWALKLLVGMRLSVQAPKKSGVRVDDWPLAGVMALLIGGALSFAWAPSGGTTIGGILLLALKPGTFNYGSFLLLLYGVGAALIYALIGFGLWPFVGPVMQQTDGMRRLEVVGGGVLLVASILLGFNLFTPMVEGLGGLLPILARLG